MATQFEKMTPGQSRTRSEIVFDFSKDLATMENDELNRAINNWRRYKAMQIEQIRRANPDFASNPSDHKFDREKILFWVKRIISQEQIPMELMDEDYYTAEAFVEWYNGEKNKSNLAA